MPTPLPRLRADDWAEITPTALDAVLAAERLSVALERTGPDLARLLHARLAYASAARLVFGAEPIPHTDLHDVLFGRAPQDGDRVARRDGVARAAEIHTAILDAVPPPRPNGDAPRSASGVADALPDLLEAASRAPDGAVVPGSLEPSEVIADQVRCLRVLASAGVLPPSPPPVLWRTSDADVPSVRRLAALRAIADAFGEALRTVQAARAFEDRALTTLRGNGHRSAARAEAMVRALAGLPVLARSSASAVYGVPVGKSQFHTWTGRLVELGLARELTGRRSGGAWVADDPALTPSFRLPARSAAPPRADRLAADAPLALGDHDAAAAAPLAELDRLLDPNDG